MHLKQQGFTYSACGSLTKRRERIQEFAETGKLRHSTNKLLKYLLNKRL